MQKLIIDRRKWRTGGDESDIRIKGPTSLYNDLGYSCCLGFYCRQIGKIRNKVLLDVDTPDNLTIKNFNKIELLISRDSNNNVYDNSDFTNDAVLINDDSCLSNEEREEAIIEHFKKANIEVVFKNEYP